MRVRTHLLRFGAAVMVPFVAVAAGVAAMLVAQERVQVQRASAERARAVLSAVDEKLRGSITSLQALAVSPALQAGRLDAFREEAIRFLGTQPDWQNLTLGDLDGRQVVNAKAPKGAVLPEVADAPSARRALASLQPAIGVLSREPVTGRLRVPVRLPVLRDGKGVFVLTASVRPETFAEVLEAQRLSPNSAIGVVDASRRFVARIPYRPPGAEPAAVFRDALESGREFTRGRTLEGVDTYQSNSLSAFSGWGVGIATPAAEVDAPAWDIVALMGGGAALAFAIAFALAAYFGARLARPIGMLAAQARALGAGTPALDASQGAMAEVREVARALVDAEGAIRKREARIEAALREKELLLGEIHHRVKNNLQVVDSLLDMQSHAIGDAGARAMLLECRNRVRSMALIHQTLYQSQDFAGVDFQGFLDRLLPELLRSYATHAANVAIDIRAHGVQLPIDTAVPCGLVVNELVSNALKHGFPGARKGTIVVELGRDAAGLTTLSVSNDGEALPENVDPARTEGMGLVLVRLMAEQIGATMEFRRGGPTRFALCFTLRQA